MMKAEGRINSDKLFIAANQNIDERDYWLAKLSGPLERTHFPYDFYPAEIGRAAEGTPDIDSVSFRFSDELFTAAVKLSGGNDLKFHMILVAGLMVLLEKYTGHKDIMIGSPILKQDTETEFVNTVLVFRNRVAKNMTFKQLLLEVRETIVKAAENQNYPMAVLVDKLNLPVTGNESPLFDVALLLENIHDKSYLDDIYRSMTFIFGRAESDMEGVIRYDSRLYRPGTIRGIANHFTGILEAALADVDVFLGRIDMLSPEEREQLLTKFNQPLQSPDLPEVQAQTLHQAFEKQVMASPDRIAVVHGGHQVTYRVLAEKADTLARLLRQKGVGPDTIAALWVPPSVEMMVGQLGILKSGGAYLPIALDAPEQRIRFILADSSARVLLKKSEIRISKFETNPNDRNSNDQNKISTPVVLNFEDLDFELLNGRPRRELSDFEFHAWSLRNLSFPLAYIIYTSGTTGQPKGVMVEHRQVMVYLHAFYREFDVKPRDAVIQLAPYSFDVFIEEVYSLLLKGGKVIIPTQEQVLEMRHLSALISRHQVSIIDCTPLLLNEFNKLNPDEFSSVRLFINGGDILKPEYISNLSRIGTVYNTYGPTETTVCASYYRCTMYHQGVIPIGKPIGGYNVYILDEGYSLQPIGVAGEICIAGAGVTRGYLNRPELTAEKFLFVSYKSYRSYSLYFSKKLYRTGDLGRWLPDGNIEFLGRMDHQVKIRGYRIEAGEIEHQLLKRKEIKEAVVVPRENKEGEKYLCAYIVSEDEVEISVSQGSSELREYLLERVPDYMVPLFFVPLERIPLNANGKIDREALPEPEVKSAVEYIPPCSPIEERLVQIWQDVLGVERIGVKDDFFDLGGHSLRGIQVASEIHKVFNVDIQFIEVFQGRTIENLAQYIIKAGGKDKFISIESSEKKEYYPLSSAQKRLYFLQQMDVESTTYNMPLILPLILPPGQSIEIVKLNSTLQELIARHESLRTSFEQVNEEPVQWIHDPGEIEFAVEYFDLSAYEVEDPGNRERYASISRGFVRSFDLSKAPLIRSGLIKCPGGNHIWMVDIHHIVSDGTSHSILVDDFFYLYKGDRLEPLRLQYKDFSHWQNRLFESGAIKVQEDYWLGLYSDVNEIPRLNLVGDFKRPEVFTFGGDSYMFVLERDDAVKFKALGTQNGGTLYMNLLAALNTLFYKYTGQTDIIIGSGIAGRPHANLQHIIGMFVNMLAMRNYPQSEKTYLSFLKEIIRHSLQAFENQDIQFEELVDRLELERNPSRNPLFDISMVVQNFRQPGRDDSKWENSGQMEQVPLVEVDENFPTIGYRNRISRFDMTFFIFERGEEVYITVEYYTGMFKEETIQRLAAHFKNVIRAVVKTPFIRLKDIEIIPEEEKRQVLYEFNDTAMEFPAGKPIHRLFEAQVERTPGHMAVIGPERSGESIEQVQITYRELNEKANRLARYLCAAKGIQPEDRVGIWMSPLLYRPVSILGVLKAGAAYVPIDPSQPVERVKYMIDDASIPVMISEKKFIKKLNRLQWECEDFRSYLCVDSFEVHGEDEVERNELMDEELWHHVGETAVDDITGGGWVSSYTGDPLSVEEMDEYGDNILKKLAPLLHQEMRVLEIGCASGISMYRIAPRVGLYYGTDLSAVIIDKNKKRVEEQEHRNIKLSCLAAHEIHKIGERNFDLVIMNSVIQCFHGHNYLRKVICQAVELLGEEGYLFIGDIMDQDKKDVLMRELREFKHINKDRSYTTKTDFSAELFVPRRFWTDLAVELREIGSVELTEKIYTIENELTRFRYDALLSINKKLPMDKKRIKHKYKYQDDLGRLSLFDKEALHVKIPTDNLAYIIYTSGTTGQPKGVMIRHGSLVNLCNWHNRYYQISEADNATIYAGFGFDASVWEMFPYLLKGASLHLIDDSIKLDIEALDAYYERNHISVSFLPTQFCEQFMEQGNRSLRLLLTGGDKIRTFVKRSYDLYNNYGPTENTVVTTSYPVEKALANIPIGKPLDNTMVYILDREGLHAQPVGAAGELCIGGVGLTRGYINDPELTAEKFIFDSCRSNRFYRTYSSKRIYKTGDSARWLGDGNIEFLGRIDYQVKIRGYRIELGEIESRLMALEGIKEAVVTTGEDEDRQKYLCAYIVSNREAVDMSELRSQVSDCLPDYMVPAYFMQLEAIPLTINGKVDRRKLPKPEIIAGEGYTAPRNTVEEKLVEIWAVLLNVEKENIGINSNFFDLGGHSLKATILVARIHKELNVKVPLALVFTSPTIKELSEYIRGTEREHHISIEPTEEKEYYPLSSAQKRLYILHQLAANSAYYNMPSVIELERGIDKDKLEGAFKNLIARHESLRTSFETVHEEPVQKVHKEVDFLIGQNEMNEADAEDIISGFTRPFDLSTAPLLRVSFVDAGASRQVLFIDMHHIITDGTSHDILKKEFMEFYRGEPGSLPPLKLQYKDYSQWLDSEEQQELRKQQETYWLKEFAYDDELPVLNLPTDYPRPFLQSFQGNWMNFAMSARETSILKDIAGENDVTLYMILLAVFNVLFSKLSGQEDIVLGTPIAARRHTDLQHVIGMMVNTLPMRNYPSGDKQFHQFLKEVKQRTLEAYENQEYPFEQLVDHITVNRDTSRNPLFDVLLNLLNQSEYPGEIAEADIAEEPPYHHKRRTSRFDMSFSGVDMGERIFFNFEYSTRLFTPGTMERFIRYLKNIVLSLPGNRGEKILDIEYIAGEEKEVILELCSGVSEMEIPGVDVTVDRMFEEKSREAADRTALVFADQHLGYGELNRRSQQLARLLREKGVGADAAVGVMVERSLEMIIALLAVLKAGGAYVPIDPEYPRERIDYMLKDSGARVLLSELSELSRVSERVEVIDLSSLIVKNEDVGPTPLTYLTHPDHLFYIIYTSGSTGKPKGVMLEHRNIANLIRYQYNHTNIDFDRVLQFTTISFDVSAQEIFSTLAAGGRLVLISKETLNDIPELFGVIKKEDLKTLFVPASFLKFVMNEKEYAGVVPGCLKHIVTAGEQVIINERFRKYLRENKVYLHNHYGPSETHAVTALTLAPEGDIPELPTIGRPISNTAIYILDKGMHLLPVGVAGELVIGGMQVGRGYSGRVQLTAEKFLSNPFSSGEQLYRTGDLARWLRDGSRNLEFLGRIDHQVKIRGFRVELGEIESQLLNHQQIKECVVVAREDEKRGRHLCAYIVSHQELSISGIREYLGRILPDYMIPSYFVFLERIPLTPNRKIDRRALPVPEPEAVDNYIAPGNPLEEKLVEIWAEVLKIRRHAISVESNFFQLGGHSLTATILAARVHKEFRVKLPLAEFFRVPTIRGLSKYLKGLLEDEDKYGAVEPVEKKDYYVLSSAQKRLYILHQMDMKSTVYNMPEVIPLAEAPGVGKLAETFGKLIRRHETLRTSFEIVNGEPVQRIHDEVDFAIKFYDLTREDTGEDKKRTAGKETHHFVKPFDLSKAPLLRVGLIKAAEETHLLHVDMHHIICDGISHLILLQDFNVLDRGEELSSLRIQYKDFSQWQNSVQETERLKQEEKYWLEQFRGEVPVLDLPLDFTRPVVQSFEGSGMRFEMGSDETDTLRKVAVKEGATLFMVLLALYNILLSKLSGKQDIIVGIPVAGRRNADMQKMIGMFVNTLALRNELKDEMLFIEFLRELRPRTLAAFENQEYPFEDLVEKVSVDRDVSRNPLFDVMFALQNFADYQEKTRPGEIVSEEIKELTTANFDLTLSAVETGSGLVLTFNYCTALFRPQTIERFIAYFKNIITGVTGNTNIKISDIEMIPAEEKDRILYEFNHTEMKYPGGSTIHELFAEQAEKTPDSVSVIGRGAVPPANKGERTRETVQITYRELNRKSDQLAYMLRERGVVADGIAAIMVERSIEMIIGIMGILKAGGAYLPIDPDYPEERKQYMLADSNAGILLSEVSEVSKETENVGLSDLSEEHPTHLCYIIYTSGSTGVPKGVGVEHRQAVNTLLYRKETYEMNSAHVSLQLFSFAFDGFVTSFFTPVICGTKVVLPGKEEIKDVSYIKDTIARHGVTHFISIPGFYRAVLESLVSESLESLEVVTLAGDTLPPPLLELSRQKNRDLEIAHEYGVTEAAVMSTLFRHQEINEKVTIGGPIGNVGIYILDGNGHIQAVGLPGEMCIGGAGVSRGYLNCPELTAERFIYWSYRTYSSQKIYKTGDLARWLADGNIEFLGRIDQQVKIRGYRIELGEIENRLLKHPGVKEAIVLTKETDSGDSFLCAYIVPAAGETAVELREYLAAELPDYLIPSYFLQLEEIPLTPNGKIDHRALPAPVLKQEEYIASGDDIEEKLVGIWSNVLQMEKEKIGINDNFFRLGGHSLKATIMMSRINQEFCISVPLVEVFKTPTIRQLSRYIRGVKGETVPVRDDGLVLLKKGHGKAGAFFFIHDGSGEVEGYIEFCNRLEGEFDSWGIRAEKIENYTPRNLSIEEVAQKYIEKIRSVQAQGPYHIAGWSIGGTIGFEMVRLLEEQNEEIGFFALIDTVPPDPDWPARGVEFNLESELKLIGHYFPGGAIKKRLEAIEDINGVWPEVLAYLEQSEFKFNVNPDEKMNHVNALKSLVPDDFTRTVSNLEQISIKEFISHLNTLRTFDNARNKYIPAGKINTAVHFFKASKTGMMDAGKWNIYCTRPVKEYDIPGDHYSIFKMPAVKDFAALFNSVIIREGSSIGSK